MCHLGVYMDQNPVSASTWMKIHKCRLGVYMDETPLVPGYDAVCCLGVYMDKNPLVPGIDKCLMCHLGVYMDQNPVSASTWIKIH